MEENEIGTEVVTAAIKVHTALGPGLLESVYEAALAIELQRRGLRVLRQYPLNVDYDGVDLGVGFKLDLLIQNKVIVELKSVEKMQPVFNKQTLTYLRLSRLKLGYLINLNVPRLKEGITRIVNGLEDGKPLISSPRSPRPPRDIML